MTQLGKFNVQSLYSLQNTAPFAHIFNKCRICITNTAGFSLWDEYQATIHAAELVTNGITTTT